MFKCLPIINIEYDIIALMLFEQKVKEPLGLSSVCHFMNLIKKITQQ